MPAIMQTGQDAAMCRRIAKITPTHDFPPSAIFLQISGGSMRNIDCICETRMWTQGHDFIAVFLFGTVVGFGADRIFTGAKQEVSPAERLTISNPNWLIEPLLPEARAVPPELPLAPTVPEADIEPGTVWDAPTGEMKPCFPRSKLCFLLAEDNR
jgi:hypothetical protein